MIQLMMRVESDQLRFKTPTSCFLSMFPGAEIVLTKWRFDLVNPARSVIDKPLLIKRMLGKKRPGIPEAQLGQYDRIIDATGQRVYLPSYSPHSIGAIEIRTKVSSPMLPTAFTNDNGGYTWLIPLNNGEAHLGSFSPQGIDEAKREAGKLQAEINAGPTICVCQERIWTSGPILPFTQGNIWGLGQSIGLVDPVIGAGIIPAMDSARMMVENWDNLAAYQKQVSQTYNCMSREARIVKCLADGRMPRISDTPSLRKAAHQTGIYPDFVQIIKLLRLAVNAAKAG